MITLGKSSIQMEPSCSASTRGALHEHPSLMSREHGTPGNGLLLFFRVDDFDLALQRARALVARLEEEPHVNPEHSSEGVLAPRSGRILCHDQCRMSERPDKALQPTAAGPRVFGYDMNSGCQVCIRESGSGAVAELGRSASATARAWPLRAHSEFRAGSPLGLLPGATRPGTRHARIRRKSFNPCGGAAACFFQPISCWTGLGWIDRIG